MYMCHTSINPKKNGVRVCVRVWGVAVKVGLVLSLSLALSLSLLVCFVQQQLAVVLCYY